MLASTTKRAGRHSVRGDSTSMATGRGHGTRTRTLSRVLRSRHRPVRRGRSLCRRSTTTATCAAPAEHNDEALAAFRKMLEMAYRLDLKQRWCAQSCRALYTPSAASTRRCATWAPGWPCSRLPATRRCGVVPRRHRQGALDARGLQSRRSTSSRGPRAAPGVPSRSASTTWASSTTTADASPRPRRPCRKPWSSAATSATAAISQTSDGRRPPGQRGARTVR